MLALLTLFTPLLSFFLCFFGKRFLSRSAVCVTACLCLGISATTALVLFNNIALKGATLSVTWLPWIKVAGMTSVWGAHFDPLTSVMIVVVTSVSFLVHIYSTGYMAHDSNTSRFMAYLGLFTFMMLMLVSAKDMIQLFFGWEGVGLASYLLIGFWSHKDSANNAAIKAFVTNRVGDLGLIMGLGGLAYMAQSLDIATLLNHITLSQSAPILTVFNTAINAYELTALCLFVGAMGKSAQFGLHIWLPDAMEGPTPVSALIHAATMVTAGVFLLTRLSPLFEMAPLTQKGILFIGALTTFFAATVALRQNDIKRIIAFSTCSQLGYMFMALGVGAYHIALFHLATHAFFKALLFLGAGSVIHGMSDEQDIQKMGGIYRGMPFTMVMMILGTLAITGTPFFAGFYSKDAILAALWFKEGSLLSKAAFGVGLLSAGLTAFYSWRLIYKVFFGAPRADEKVMGHLHESDAYFKVPLFILSLGAVFSGALGIAYVGDGTFWRGSLVGSGIPYIHGIAHYIPFMVGACGWALASFMYLKRTSSQEKLGSFASSVHTFLQEKWYIDVFYEKYLQKPWYTLGSFCSLQGDQKTLDAYGPDGLSKKVMAFARRLKRTQSGYIYDYALWMIVAFLLLVAVARYV